MKKSIAYILFTLLSILGIWLVYYLLSWLFIGFLEIGMFWKILSIIFLMGFVGTIFSNLLTWIILFLDRFNLNRKYVKWILIINGTVNLGLIIYYFWTYEEGIILSKVLFTFIAFSITYQLIKISGLLYSTELD